MNVDAGDRVADGHAVTDDSRLDQIAYAFAGVVDAKSPWTYRHSDRARLIVIGLASALGADVGMLRDLRRAGLLHDIGKLAISNRILDKPRAAHELGVRTHPRAPARHRAHLDAGSRLRAHRVNGRRAPRAPRRWRLPARTACGGTDDAHEAARDR